ncbi:MAG: beta-galactosidase [Thermoproteota archaeon]
MLKKLNLLQITLLIIIILLSYAFYLNLQKLREAEHQLSEYKAGLKSLTSLILNLYDDYGGMLDLKGETTGFFHVEKIDDVLWIIDPEGNFFISKGVNHVSFEGDYSPALGFSPYRDTVLKKYGNAESWSKATVDRLRTWGFNTIGAWSSEETFRLGIPYTIILDIAASAGSEWVSGSVVDYFSEKFREVADNVARRKCSPRRDDKYLLGYFTDNELRWGPDWRSPKHLFDEYFSLEKDAPGKRALMKYLKDKYGLIEALNSKWGTSFTYFEDILEAFEVPENVPLEDKLGFLEIVSERYFQVCYEAIRKYDPNHLILGCRFAFKPPDEVLKGCIGYVDIISINNYDLEPPLEDLRAINAVTDLPVILTEFSFKAMDSGLPNTRGAGIPLATQEERASHYEKYVEMLLSEPYVLGYHWFQYTDQPARGRFDGENSNFGLVKINDEEWVTLIVRATVANFKAELIHKTSRTV